MRRKLFFLLFFLYVSISIKAQNSGNEVYNQGYNSSYNSQKTEKIYFGDSAIIVKAKVLYNVIADNYVAVFGLSQESINIEDCNNKIDERISGFKLALRKMGILPENIYVDMTTQNKIYDYKLEGNVAEEYLQGFELKKNVNVRFKNIKDLDNMIIIAADYKIYDLVKLDYLVDDQFKIYTLLYKSAIEVINQKKELFVSSTNMKLLSASQVYSENFYSYTPSQLYRSYLAYESGDVNTPYKSNYTVKEIRKNKTYYYNKIDYSGFEKIINPSITEPAIEFVLELAIKFEIDVPRR